MSNDPTAPIKNSPISQNNFPLLVLQDAQGVPLSAQQWPLTVPRVSIGRAADNTIVIPHNSVSRYHALLELREGRWWVQSLRSDSNPVQLRGVPVSNTAPLDSTDELCIGVVTFRFLAPQSIAIEETLPFPLAFALRQPETAASSERRLRASLLSIELVLRFLFAAEVGWLLASKVQGDLIRSSLLHDLRPDQPISMGTCVHLVTRLMRHFERGQDPLALALANLEQVTRGALQNNIEKMVRMRNDLVHRWFGEENAFEAEAQEASAMLRAMVHALVPMRALSMVSWLSNDGSPTLAGWPLRWLQGPSSQFPLRVQSLPGAVHPNWCYLLGDAGMLIPLFPSFAVATSTKTRRLDLFISRSLSASKAAGQMDGLTCSHETQVHVPSDPQLHVFP